MHDFRVHLLMHHFHNDWFRVHQLMHHSWSSKMHVFRIIGWCIIFTMIGSVDASFPDHWKCMLLGCIGWCIIFTIIGLRCISWCIISRSSKMHVFRIIGWCIIFVFWTIYYSFYLLLDYSEYVFGCGCINK